MSNNLNVLFVPSHEADYDYDFPEINFDPFTGKFKVLDRSQNAYNNGVYKPIFDWLDKYARHPHNETELTFQFTYFDSGDTRAIVKIIDLLKDVPNFKVIWVYHEENEDMEEWGEDFAKVCDVSFHLHRISGDWKPILSNKKEIIPKELSNFFLY